MIDYLPNDIIEKFVQNLDIHSILKFRCCCKTSNTVASQELFKTSLIRTVNERLKGVIELVQEYYKALNQVSVRNKIIHTLLNELYLRFKQRPFEHVSFIQHMLRYVSENANCSRDDVIRVWFYYMNNLDISNENQTVIQELEKFSLSKNFSLLFQYTDCNNQGKHYIQLEFDFENETKPMLGFTMQDVINDKDTNKQDMEAFLEIPNADYDQDGFMRFEVSDANIMALSKFIVNVMGLDAFVFETDLVSYIKCHSRLWFSVGEDFVEKQVGKYVDREEYREKVIDILGLMV